MRDLVKDNLITEIEDGTNLSYPDNYFDRVMSISAVEHFEGESGDTNAMKEIGRVLKPGGRAVVSVPFGREYIEREKPYWVGYYSRYYDKTTLYERLINPSGLKLIKLIFFGEKAIPPLKWLLTKIRCWTPKIFKFSFFNYVIAKIFLKVHTTEDDILKYAEGVCMVYYKE